MKALITGAILFAVLLIPATAGATTYPDGDANCDTVLTQADVTLLSDVILQRPGAALGSCARSMDLNCSGGLNIFDVVRLQRLVNGYSIPAC